MSSCLSAVKKSQLSLLQPFGEGALFWNQKMLGL